MAVMPDWMIRRDIKIEPFAEGEKRPGVISYGLSSYGYDVRLGNRFRVCSRRDIAALEIDPKRDEWHRVCLREEEGDCCVIPANGFALAETVECLEIPRDVIAICVGKSTYARCGIIVNVTPLEPEWKGKITLEISNTTPVPAKVYAGEGIAQIVFLRAEQQCEMSYADKRGKYQDQAGLTLPMVD